MKPNHNYWISTVTGKKIDYLNPADNDFDIRDIALGLSKQCRFLGQCDGHYSIAQHSVIGAMEMPTRELALEFMLHDAAEFAIGDCPSPLKRLLIDYQTIEARFDEAIRHQWRLPMVMSPEVKLMDDIMYRTERRDLTPEFVLEEGDRALAVAPLLRLIRPHSWQTALGEYMRYYDFLMHGVGAGLRGTRY